jgi:hypothetical protein
VKGVARRPEQAFAIEKPAAHDQGRRLIEKRWNSGKRLDDIGVGGVRV